MRPGVAAAVFLAALSASQATTAAQEPKTPEPDACCVMGRGAMGHGMMGSGHGSMLRHRAAMMEGIPAQYRSLSNPLPRTSATIERGVNLYARNCASCHGATGRGDGEAGRGLSPPPANLTWLSQTPMSRWDPFLYWTIAQGGKSLGTAMPGFEETLSKDDIWAVITYLQARLPAAPKQQP